MSHPQLIKQCQREVTRLFEKLRKLNAGLLSPKKVFKYICIICVKCCTLCSVLCNNSTLLYTKIYH